MNERHDDLQEIIDAALREMAAEEGDGFDPQTCNLAEFCRRTGLTRSRARTVRAHGFRALPHGNSGRRAAPGVLAGHTGLVDDLLRKGVTNSQVIFERLLGQGYAGGLTTVKTYIAAHRDLVPAKRRQAAPQVFVSSSGFQLRQRFFSHVARKGFRFGKGVPLSLFGFAS